MVKGLRFDSVAHPQMVVYLRHQNVTSVCCVCRKINIDRLKKKSENTCFSIIGRLYNLSCSFKLFRLLLIFFAKNACK